MVQSAEAGLLADVQAVLAGREAFTLGVARDELLIDGEAYVTKSTYARDLATRLHRRGVGAITFTQGVALTQISEALTWLAAERDFLPFAPTRAGGVLITTIGYDHLVLDDSLRSAEATVSVLWRTLAALAEAGTAGPGAAGRAGPIAGAVGTGSGTGTGATGSGTGAGTGGGIGTGSGAGIGSRDGAVRDDATPVDPDLEQAIDEAVAVGAAVYVDGELSGVDSEQVVSALRASMQNPAVARRTAMALADVAASARITTPEARQLIGQQLHGLLDQLGTTSFAPILESLSDRGSRTRFVSDVADALPLGAVVHWIQNAAVASEQQMSHQILRIMTKLSTLAETRAEDEVEAGFREAARDLVANWELDDPNPTEHVELLDRIARFERSSSEERVAVTAIGTSVVETSRIVQMALELDFAGEDTAAAADALVASGAGPTLMEWGRVAGATRTSHWLYGVATSEKAVRQLLLTEPVDRLQARALLGVLDASSADVLLDVLEHAEARGTRMIVRQRLSEFGGGIAPQLIARIDNAPWFLVRNILTLLQDMDGDVLAEAAAPLVTLMDHPQVQVRTETLRVLIRHESWRDGALRRALRDDNERIVVLAIQLIMDLVDSGAPLAAGITTQLMTLVQSGEQSDPVRARAVRAIAAQPRGDVRDWLVTLVCRRTPFLRRLKLVDPSQTAATALQLLQRGHANDPAVARVLALAARAAEDGRWQVRDVTTDRAP